MTTLRRLLAEPHLGLTVLAGADALDRTVSWAAVSELDDPTPYLEGAELLLTTGTGRALDGTPARAYVERLAAHGVCALGVGVGVAYEKVPTGLVDSAARAGLPLLEVDRPTPFIAVSKALADLIAAERSERSRRVLAGMQALTAALLGAGGAQDVVGRLARLVDGWAVVLDGRGTTLQAAGDGAADHLDVAVRTARRLRGRGRHASAVESGVGERVTALPLGMADRGGAVLVVGTRGQVPDAALLAFAASLLTIDRERGADHRGLAAWVRAAALADLAATPRPAVPPGTLDVLRDGARPLRALVLRASWAAVVAALEDAPDEATPSAAAPLGDDEADLTLVVAAAPAADGVVEALRSGLGAVVGGRSAPGGVEALPHLVLQARSLALRSRGGVLSQEEAPPSVQDLLGPDVAVAFAQAQLGPVRRGGPGADVLEDTLRTWLAHHGQTVAAAAVLGVHRHTVRERLRRVAGLLGRDLDDPQVRAELWLALSTRPG